MSFRHGISRDIAAKRERDRAAAEELKIVRIGDFVTLAKTGQISHGKALEIIRDTLNGDVDRIVRIGEQTRPDIQTEDGR